MEEFIAKYFGEDKSLELIISMCAATLTTFSFLPQTIRVIKLRETRDLSLTMFICMSVGVSFWLYLGFIYDNIVMIVANAITLALNLIILRLKLKFG